MQRFGFLKSMMKIRKDINYISAVKNTYVIRSYELIQSYDVFSDFL